MYGFIVATRLNGNWKKVPVVAVDDFDAREQVAELYKIEVEHGQELHFGELTLYTLRAATVTRNGQKCVARVAIRDGYLFYSEICGIFNVADNAIVKDNTNDVVTVVSGPTNYIIKFDKMVIPLKNRNKRIPVALAA